MAKVIHISEVNTAELFPMREFMLGDGKGDWFVVEDELYLGRYEDKMFAQDHADSLNNSDGIPPTKEEMVEALKFAGIEPEEIQGAIDLIGDLCDNSPENEPI